MRRRYLLWLTCSLLVLLVAGCDRGTPAQDAQDASDPAGEAEAEEAASAESEPAEAEADAAIPWPGILEARADAVTVLFENEWVRAIRFTLEPGDALPLHEGPAHVVFAETDATIRWTAGEGEPVARERSAGGVHTHPAGPHAVENLGEETISWLVFARLDAELPEQDEHHHDVAHSDPEHAELRFEDDLVRAIFVELAEGEETALHMGGPRVILALRDYRIRYEEEGSEAIERALEAGSVHWHDAGEHKVSNIGESVARYMVFQFRR